MDLSYGIAHIAKALFSKKETVYDKISFLNAEDFNAEGFNENGETPLIAIIEQGIPAEVKDYVDSLTAEELKTALQTPDRTPGNVYLPLTHAVRRFSKSMGYEIAALLLEKGADPNATNEQNDIDNAAKHAVFFNNTAALQLLHENGADFLNIDLQEWLDYRNEILPSHPDTLELVSALVAEQKTAQKKQGNQPQA